MNLIQSLKLTIENHENWYNKVKKIAEKVDISEANMTKNLSHALFVFP